ncbi:MAG: hypothetical protein EBZ68_05420 [Actinobacteria bacterium]|nr:hypothetical protein [Actinomycetota bacterium]
MGSFAAARIAATVARFSVRGSCVASDVPVAVCGGAGCGLRWERNYEGFMLGAMAISFITTGGSLLLTMAIGVIATYPDVALVPVLGSTVAVTLLVGVFGYPVSYTLWQAVDLHLRPVSEDDGEDHGRAIVN